MAVYEISNPDAVDGISTTNFYSLRIRFSRNKSYFPYSRNGNQGYHILSSCAFLSEKVFQVIVEQAQMGQRDEQAANSSAFSLPHNSLLLLVACFC